MSTLVIVTDIVRSAVAGLVEGLRARIAPLWRWGHGYPASALDVRCIYCDRSDPFRQRVTSPICSGPTAARAAEIKAAGGARYFRSSK